VVFLFWELEWLIIICYNASEMMNILTCCQQYAGIYMYFGLQVRERVKDGVFVMGRGKVGTSTWMFEKFEIEK
jgi:hypothetical protein